MKKTCVLFLLLLCLVSTRSYAQLNEGCKAPDFTLTDLNGNTHRLYDYLSQGKTVVIDFMATWCTPCWNFHQGHMFENLYNTRGPNGNLSQDIMVLMIESDASTPLNALYGTQQPTEGNWVAGVSYPIFSPTNENVPNAFGVNSYPSIFVICADTTISYRGILASNLTSENFYNQYVKKCECKAPYISGPRAISQSTGYAMAAGNPVLEAFEFQVKTPGDLSWRTFPPSEIPLLKLPRLNPPYASEVRVRALCHDTWTGWSVSTSYIFPYGQSCDDGAPITSAVVTGPHSAVFTAQYFEEGKKYQLRYRLDDSSQWTTVSALQPYFEVTDLQASARYFYQMRVYCGGAWGDWSYGYNFNTLCD